MKQNRRSQLWLFVWVCVRAQVLMVLLKTSLRTRSGHLAWCQWAKLVSSWQIGDYNWSLKAWETNYTIILTPLNTPTDSFFSFDNRVGIFSWISWLYWIIPRQRIEFKKNSEKRDKMNVSIDKSRRSGGFFRINPDGLFNANPILQSGTWQFQTFISFNHQRRMSLHLKSLESYSELE